MPIYITSDKLFSSKFCIPPSGSILSKVLSSALHMRLSMPSLSTNMGNGCEKELVYVFSMRNSKFISGAPFI